MLDINKLINAESLAGGEANEFLMDMEPWTEGQARKLAKAEELELTEEHMEVLCWLRDHFAECGPTDNGRTLTRALDESFAAQGGLKYLYRLFPKGPVTQGCRLAGLPVPPGSLDKSFGTTH